MNDLLLLYILVSVALTSSAVNVIVAIITLRRVEQSQPTRLAVELREEMRAFNEKFAHFLIALDPDHVTELVARHKRRFESIERVQAAHSEHLVQHDGDIVAVKRDTDALRVRVATLEEQKG